MTLVRRSQRKKKKKTKTMTPSSTAFTLDQCDDVTNYKTNNTRFKFRMRIQALPSSKLQQQHKSNEESEETGNQNKPNRILC